MAILTDEIVEIIQARFSSEKKFMEKALNLEVQQQADYDTTDYLASLELAGDMLNGICEKYAGREQSSAFYPAELVNDILKGYPICPLLGTEDEWEPEIAENLLKMIGSDIWFTQEHLEGTCIHIESIDYNIRYPMIKRFNHDNRTAHRTDAVTYIDYRNGKVLSPEESKATSIRFIEFPYSVKESVKYVVDLETQMIVQENGDTSVESMGTQFPRFITELIDKDKELHPEDYELADEEDDDNDEEDEEDLVVDSGDDEDADITEEEKSAIEDFLSNSGNPDSLTIFPKQ